MDLNLFDYESNAQPEKGCLLISEPFLQDGNFERTVILICEHNSEGTFGFVLNKETEMVVSDLMLDGLSLESNVFLGGPVQKDTFHFIHKNPLLKGAIKVTDEIFWGGDFEELKTLNLTSDLNNGQYKFFIGYSGWSPGQLEEEIERKSWIVANNLNDDIIMHEDAKNMWRIVLNELGGKFSLISTYPVDPRMN